MTSKIPRDFTLQFTPCSGVELKNIIFSNACPIYLHSTTYKNRYSRDDLREGFDHSKVMYQWLNQNNRVVMIFRLLRQRLPVGLLNSFPGKNFGITGF